MLNCFTNENKKAISIQVITQKDYSAWLKKQNSFIKKWLESSQFRSEAGCTSLVPDASGQLSQVVTIVPDKNYFWCVGNLPYFLPEGVYSFDAKSLDEKKLAIAWGLGAYQFTVYKKPLRKPAQLFLKKSDEVSYIVESIYLCRDLINIPTDDMGPTELAKATDQLAKKFQAKVKHIVGDDLLKQNYPLIYAVGRASDDAPRLIDLRWGNKKHKKITLVGKGVCFDSGGLDIKPSSYMLLMKKDMGGAAHVLALARMIMQAKLPVNLRVLIPAVENVISGNAYRPGDIFKSRKGLTVEIGNTDAEGRLVLADALTEACSEKPDLLIDIATLTGAARVALGTELPALFCNDDEVAHEVVRASNLVEDPIWRLPLFSLYRELLNSPYADINNAGQDSYAGAITAALFLKEFVPDNIPWMHFDLMAWNLRPRPGRPQGGEAMALRTLFHFIRNF
jgi:leucyl aminopeptidase